MALVWRPEQLKLEVLCIRKGEVERVLDVTAHGLETVRKNLEAGRLTSSIHAFLENGGEQLQLVRTRGNKVISWLETYTYASATTDDENEEPPQSSRENSSLPSLLFIIWYANEPGNLLTNLFSDATLPFNKSLNL